MGKLKEFLGFWSELIEYARERKKFILFPILMFLVILGALVVFTQGTVISPFIYTLF